MGIDCVALLPHTLLHPEQLDVEAITSGPAMRKMVELWERIYHNSENWTRTAESNFYPYSSFEEHWEEKGYVWLGLPGGFSLTVGKRLIELYHGMHWGTFMIASEHRANFRNVCRELALQLGCSRWVYVPDHVLKPADASYFLYSGGGFKHVRRFLWKRCGRPKLDPNRSYTEEEYYALDGDLMYFFDGLDKFEAANKRKVRK